MRAGELTTPPYVQESACGDWSCCYLREDHLAWLAINEERNLGSDTLVWSVPPWT